MRTEKALILIRLLVGAVFLSEGVQKFLYPDALGVGRFMKIGIPLPQFLAPFVGGVEIACGALLLLGLFTRLAAVPLLGVIATAIATTKVPLLLKDGFWKAAHEARTDWAMLLGLVFLVIAGAGAMVVGCAARGKAEMSALAHLDVRALLWVNHAWSSPFLDAFFSFVTEQRNYVVPAAALAVYWWLKHGLKGRMCLGALLLCVALSDPLASRVIKPAVHRLRPCAAVPGVLTPHGDRGTFSFPSSHAVNIAGAGVVTASAFPQLAVPAAVLVVLVGLSRVYLGLHYPSDVLLGYLLGATIGALCWRLVAAAERRWRARSEAPAA